MVWYDESSLSNSPQIVWYDESNAIIWLLTVFNVLSKYLYDVSTMLIIPLNSLKFSGSVIPLTVNWLVTVKLPEIVTVL